MKKYIEKLHFITHTIPHYTHIEQALLACEAGAKWIQYRCLSKADEELLIDINSIAEICDDWGATLIVTNHVHLKGKADIQGFHIEDMGADFAGLRQQIGEEYTLGGSANTVDNLIRLAKEGADYAGFGPFKLTTTKPNSSPLLGIKGYVEAIAKLKAENIHLPILAVGGIILQDIAPLLATGIYGIAASSAINRTEDLRGAYESFYKAIL
jgi:thiamine-phosphate pyrophosphorylase